MTAKPSRLTAFLPYQLSTASNAVSARLALAYRQRFGLSVPEWRVMAVLGDMGPLIQRELTRLTLMDKVAVNRAARGLEDRGLIAREPNARDGRSHLLALTSAGKRMHDEIIPLAEDMGQRIFHGFSPQELAIFREVLEKVRRVAAQLDDAPLPGLDAGFD